MLKVSVIITTFNSEKTISKTLASVLNQQGIGREFDLELIVVDDCSTDSTVDILRDSNINFYYTTSSNSGGPNRGRNIGLKNATGDYICFLDHDDTWARQKIFLQLQAVEIAPIITCGYNVIHSINGRRTVIAESETSFNVFSTNKTFLSILSKEKNRAQHAYLSTIMIHKNLKDHFFEERFGMLDFDWSLRLFENSSSVELKAVLVSRFVNGSNLSLDKEYRKRDYYYSLMCLEAYEKKYGREVAMAVRRINGSRARFHYVIGEMQEARKHLWKAMPGGKEVLYYLTTFFGSDWVKKHFVVFG